MRTRAFRPEVPACLEERSLLSGVGGLSDDPVVLLNRRLHKVAVHVRQAFLLFTRDAQVDVGEEISNVIVWIPFGKVDGLGEEINSILDRMQQELSANGPQPTRSSQIIIRSAQNDVLAVTLAEVQARIRTGDVVVR